jgi:hypothetical protein
MSWMDWMDARGDAVDARDREPRGARMPLLGDDENEMTCDDVFLYKGTVVRSYFRLNEPTGGRQRRMSFQLGTGNGFAGRPVLSTTECRNPRTIMAVTSFSSTLARRVPRHTVFPVQREINDCSERHTFTPEHTHTQTHQASDTRHKMERCLTRR